MKNVIILSHKKYSICDKRTSGAYAYYSCCYFHFRPIHERKNVLLVNSAVAISIIRLTMFFLLAFKMFLHLKIIFGKCSIRDTHMHGRMDMFKDSNNYSKFKRLKWMRTKYTLNRYVQRMSQRSTLNKLTANFS